MYNSIRISVSPSRSGTWIAEAVIPGDPGHKVWSSFVNEDLATCLADIGAQLQDDLRNLDGKVEFRPPQPPKPPPRPKSKKS